MTFMESVRHVLSNYANFEGRAVRSEYWWFVLFYLLAQFVGAILDLSLFPGSFGPIGALLTLALLLPYLAVGAWRLHDIGNSGWWLLISIVPIIGFLVLLYFFVQRGTDGSNRFGESPLSVSTQSNLTL